MEWAEWIGVHENKRVAQDEANGYVVSTVFLGLDHSFTANGPPILFETMVFRSEDWHEPDPDKRRLADQDMDRYATWDEAMKGHRRMLWKYKGGEVIEGGAA